MVTGLGNKQVIALIIMISVLVVSAGIYIVKKDSPQEVVTEETQITANEEDDSLGKKGKKGKKTKAQKYKDLIANSSIEKEIKNLNKVERAELKSYTIKDKTKLGKYSYQIPGSQALGAITPGYEVEIVSVNVIAGGVEVLAKAWKDGQPVGFGKDGTVEIERFLIYNPPVLVPNANGTIARHYPIDPMFPNGELTTRYYSEDPEKAIKNVIGENISIIGKSGENIIAGKVGNTSSTFYPNADGDAGKTTFDGYSWRSNTVGFSDVRSGAGDGSNDNATILALQNDRTDAGGNTYTIYRSPVLFDTSSIPDSDTIDSATLTFTPNTVDDVNSDSVALDTTTPSSNTNITTSDYNIANWGGVEQATAVTYASLTVEVAANMTLNATGEGNISKTGITKFGFRVKSDIDDVSPSASGEGRVFPYAADNTGTTKDPKLVVEHSAAAGGETVETQDIYWFQ